jgi:hypothetical protein
VLEVGMDIGFLYAFQGIGPNGRGTSSLGLS